MLTVPQPIQRIFDSVPLKVYSDQQESVLPEKLYSFPNAPSDPLILGVYNTFEYDKFVLPTDPVSLYTLLILAKKNDFGLPESTSNSNCGITRIPFRGSPSNSLPILISDGTVRAIESSEQIEKKIASKNIQSAKVLMIKEFVDTVLFDSWIACLLAEKIQPQTFYQLFGINNKLDVYELKMQIPKWNNFSIRHASLFSHHYNNQYLQAFYTSQCDEFEKAIESLKQYLQSPDPETTVIKYKVAAYAIIIDHFLKDTQVGQIMSRYPEVVTTSYAVLSS
ncbi:SAM35 [Candida theae]|uniref:SAM35 n=1 Tax=Candida theae TaxID=1198502 RepID=A0AAD5BHF3_9ASCO|nr:SAM35 [Candida theae]KAI5963851.1 SAM35 [Candida theae]